MKYFGPECSRKEGEEQVPAPVGAPCVWCEEKVGPLDMGTINHIGQVTHYECSMRSILGSLGHLQQKCHCYGGTVEDPPGMTRRQAAWAALDYWNRSE